MSTTTTRNSLVKPDYTDAADIAVLNTSLDTIDAAIAKCNYAGTAAPSVSDDSGDGYSIGSVWIDRTNNNIYVAKTVTVGAAVWTLQAMHNNFSATAAPTVNDDIDLHYAPGSLWVDVTNHNVYVCEVNTNGAAVWKQVNSASISGYVKTDGSTPLTANWNVGAFKVTANQLESTVAVGTAPILVTSTDVCPNLDADYLDGLHGTGFVKQTLADAKGDLLVASANDTWARQAVSATDGKCLVSDASEANGVSWQRMYSGRQRNLILNPEFSVNQAGITQYTSTTVPNNNDDTYQFDQWTLLSDGNDIMDLWSSSSAIPSALYGSGYSHSILLQTETANKKAGIIQFIESVEARPVIGGPVSLRFQAYTMSAYPNANIMAAVISWDSTADTVTSDVVSAWEATGTAPTLAKNWTYENVPARLALVNDTWTEYKIENILIDTASTTNIAVFIWLDDTDSTVDDRLYITGVQLNVGETCIPYSCPNYAIQLTECMRFYRVINSTGTAYAHMGLGLAYDTQYLYCEQWHPNRWFKISAAPTISNTITCLPGGANIDTVNTECVLETNVIKYGDNGKAFTAGVSYVILDSSTGSARLFIESRL